jgi:hypothetical protein
MGRCSLGSVPGFAASAVFGGSWHRVRDSYKTPGDRCSGSSRNRVALQQTHEPSTSSSTPLTTPRRVRRAQTLLPRQPFRPRKSSRPLLSAQPAVRKPIPGPAPTPQCTAHTPHDFEVPEGLPQLGWRQTPDSTAPGAFNESSQRCTGVARGAGNERARASVMTDMVK